MRHGQKWGGGAGSKAANEGSPYSDADIATLLFMLEEEKLAGDVYAQLYADTGLRIFDNIAASEDRHFAALLNQAEKIGLDVDAILAAPAGRYVDPALQALYDDLMAKADASVTDALEVGKLIEETDIIDLQAAIGSVLDTPLADVYESLLAGSENHLDAFLFALA